VVSASFIHIDALVLIPSTGFKENFLRFSEPTADDRMKRVRRLRRLESLAVASRPLQAQIQLRKVGTQESRKGILSGFDIRSSSFPNAELMGSATVESVIPNHSFSF
jgi:hypothetical protein